MFSFADKGVFYSCLPCFRFFRTSNWQTRSFMHGNYSRVCVCCLSTSGAHHFIIIDQKPGLLIPHAQTLSLSFAICKRNLDVLITNRFDSGRQLSRFILFYCSTSWSRRGGQEKWKWMSPRGCVVTSLLPFALRPFFFFFCYHLQCPLVILVNPRNKVQIQCRHAACSPWAWRESDFVMGYNNGLEQLNR